MSSLIKKVGYYWVFEVHLSFPPFVFAEFMQLAEQYTKAKN